MLTKTVIKAVNTLAKASKNGRKVNGLFRLLINPEVIWKQAYANIYSNKGALTKGVNNNTLDGMSDERINHIIWMLANHKYRPMPARRTYIPKKNGKMRPLGVPTGDDKLIQEAVRILLNQVYEPVFSNRSHGFRENRSCHTAIKEVHDHWNGMKWFIEFDIKGFFDNINHNKMIEILEKKIDDKRIINLIRSMLKSGYLENWQYNATWTGTPQGGVISPILANIYLNELDQYIEKLIEKFTRGKRRRPNSLYQHYTHKMMHVSAGFSSIRGKHGLKSIDDKRKKMRAERNIIRREMERLPSSDEFDPNYKRMKYVRYADDFIIGIIGSHQEAIEVMNNVRSFIEKELLLQVSNEKTCIKSTKKGIIFLGYELKMFTRSYNKKRRNQYGVHLCRTINKVIQAHIPQEKLYAFAKKKGYGDLATVESTSRPYLLARSDIEILQIYNSEMRGFANYYCLAQGYKIVIKKLEYLAYRSLLKTLASKHKTTTGKIARSMKLSNNQGYGITETVKGKERTYKLFRLRDHKIPESTNGSIDIFDKNQWYKLGRTELISRYNANRCEYCGKTGGYFHVHHVRGLKDVHGKKSMWQRVMSEMNRKTIVLCKDCHMELHSKSGLPNWRAVACR